MSKFIEKLEKVGQQMPSPMGFGAMARRNDSPPQVMLVGSVTAQELAKNAKLAEAAVDAILVSLDSASKSAVEKVAGALKDRLWGARVSGLDGEQAKQLKEQGCDFVVFGAEETAAAVLNDEELGKIIDLGSSLEEETARALHDFSIDAAFLAPEGKLHPLTVQKMIGVQRTISLLGKPFLVAVPSELGAGEIEVFRNAGIECLLVELSAADNIRKMKEAIDNLPRRKPKAQSRTALIPHPHIEGEPVHVDDGDDDDDDY
ncbi:MAG: hypothetical protein L0177_17700 [Chloroflexi bacterium]|nr:hypothetical protein [Chloroflexota bacterium]